MTTRCRWNSPFGSPRDRRRIGAAVLLAALSVAMPALAQPSRGNAARGGQLAETLCSRCHVVDRSGAGSWTDAPAFVAIAADPKVTRPWLRGFFQRPHFNMLNTDRPAGEADDLAAYILSLKAR